jgi:phage I-like protein
MQRFGFWTDLTTVQLDEGEAKWVHALSLGPFEHPLYGEENITEDRVKRFAQSVKDRVRGVDPDIDYEHKRNTDEAAGWVKDAEARTDGLWVLVEWTKSASAKIKDKAYRYFSAEYADEWEDPKTKVKHQDVVVGGALTNRPFLKDLVPINLSELMGDPPEPKEKEKEEGMDPKELRKLLKLSEDATDDQVTAALKKLTDPPADPPNPPDPPKPASVEDLIKTLGDTANNPGVKVLTDLLKTQQAAIVKLSEGKREVEVDRRLDELGGSAYQLPPIVREQLRTVMLTSPEAVGDQVLEAYENTLKLGVIDMTEKGWARRGGEDAPVAKLSEAVAALRQKNPDLSYADAVEQAASQDRTLYEDYRQDSFAGRE